MGIEARHSYRFGYLKSEHWQNLRIRKLAECDAKCFFCNYRDISNDVHHIHYPADILRTNLHMLVVLCRSHHARLHEVMDSMPKTEKPKGKPGVLFRADLAIFRRAAVIIEDEITSGGGHCFSNNGARLKNEKSIEKSVTISEREKSVLILIGIKDKLGSKRFSHIENIPNVIAEIDRSILEADASAKKVLSLFAADYIRNETAG
jgi:hypothetical protein